MFILGLNLTLTRVVFELFDSIDIANWEAGFNFNKSCI